MQTLFLYGYIACFEITVVLLVDGAALYGFFSHGLLHWPIGALLEARKQTLRPNAYSLNNT